MKNRHFSIIIVLLSIIFSTLISASPHKTGLRPMTSEEKARILPKMFTITKPQRLTKAPLPTYVANITHLPVVTNQGSLGSCAAYSTCYYMKTYQEAKERGWENPDPKTEPEKVASPAWGYNIAPRSESFGGMAVNHFVVADYICEYGIASWEEMPYNPEDYDWEAWPTQDVWKRGLKWRGKQAGIIKVDTPEGIEALKEYLAEGNVAIISTPVYSNFDVYPNGNYTNNNVFYANTNDDYRGGHALTVVGYDDNKTYYDSIEGKEKKGAFLLVNSWGTDWGVEELTMGTKGFIWIAYDFFLSKKNGDPDALIMIDRIDYKPKLFATIGINHTRGRNLTSHIMAGNKDLLEYPIQNPIWIKEALPHSNQYPLNSRIVIDLTDFAHYGNLAWYLQVFHISQIGGEGEINHFSIQKGDDTLCEYTEAPVETQPNWYVWLKASTFIDKEDLFEGMKVRQGGAVWADFNNDGKPDLLITGYNHKTGEPVVSTLLFINKGDKTFKEGVTGNLPQLGNSFLAVSDYNNDGFPDVAIHGYIPNTGYITKIYSNNGNNTFTDTGVELPTENVNSLSWADYDNDGLPDLAVSVSGDTEKIFLYRNLKNNNFEVVSQPINASGSISWADFDNDGWVDFIVAGKNKTSLYRNTGDGIFVETSNIIPPLTQASISWGDYNNDGLLDFAISGQLEDLSPYTAIYKNNGNSLFSLIDTYLEPLSYGSLMWGDINNDGLLDLIVCGRSKDIYSQSNDGRYYNQTNIYLNNIQDNFSNAYAELPNISYSSDFTLPQTFNTLSLIDYDSDGDLDIFLSGIKTYINTSNPNEICTGIQENLIIDKNNPPTPPTDLTSSSGWEDGAITLSWDKGSDTETPADGLYYNVRVGRTSGATEIVNPSNSFITPGYIPSQSRKFLLTGLSAGTYYWAVQTVDAGKNVSNWSGEKSFTIDPYTRTYNLHISVENSALGTTDPSPGTYSYNQGTNVTITAIPNGGHKFSHWSGDIETPSDNPATILMDRPRQVKAHFKVDYTITLPWELQTPTDWGNRYHHSTIDFKNKLWVIGGYDKDTLSGRNDVWSSTDGTTWIQETSSAGWLPRYGQKTVVFNNKLWLLGGIDVNTNMGLSDVWSSDNGKDWTRVTENAPWGKRNSFASIVFDNKLWVIGGKKYGTLFNDVWYSEDGINWIEATPSAEWQAREGHSAVVFDNKLWVIGGYYGVFQDKGDVWYSEDGINWSPATISTEWSPRKNHTSLVYEGLIWIFGGETKDELGNWSTPSNEVWYSYDGTNWRLSFTESVWTPRFGHTSTIFNNKIWVVGGSHDAEDIWSVSPTLSFPNTYELIISAGEGGTTSPSPGHYHDLLDKEFNIQAVASYGYRFKKWEGEVDTPNSESITIRLDENKSVKATFEKLTTYTLTILPPIGSGRVFPSPQTYTYPEDTLVDINSTPSYRYIFSHWEGCVNEPNSSSTSVLINQNKTITAHFIPDPFIPSMNIDGGENFTIFLQDEGTVWTWGDNTSGQLGNKTRITSNTPISYSVLEEVKKVSAGNSHSVALKDNGNVWAWGDNTFGQVGINSTSTYIEEPILVSEVSNILEISAGGYHTVALKSDGSVWAWGDNTSGQLGLGTTYQGQNFYSPKQTLGVEEVGFLKDIVGISAGYSHTLAVKSNGEVLAWGNNIWGQLGINNTIYSNLPVKVFNLTNIKSVSAGGTGLLGDHSLAVKSDGSVWAWGSNKKGQLGDKTEVDRLVPVQVKGENGVGYLKNIRQVSAGGRHSLALDKDGNIWAWGDNTYGQLGDGTNNDTNFPIKITDLPKIVQISTGLRHSIAIDEDGQLWVWGFNIKGQLGNGRETNSNIPIQLENIKVDVTSYLLEVSSIPSNGGITVPSGIKKCRPNSNILITALPDERYNFENWSGYVTGNETTVTIFMDRDKNVKANFQLKPEEKATLTMVCDPPNAGVLMPVEGEHEFEVGSLVNISVLPGYRYTFTGWSDNVSNSSAYETNIQIQEDMTVVANFIKDDFKSKPQISAGAQYNLILKDDSSVWASGLNNLGQLGINYTSQNEADKQVLTLDNDKLLGIVSISAGISHSLALSYDGTIYSWGNNNKGALGDGTTIQSAGAVKVKSPDGTEYFSCITQVSAGAAHSAAIMMDGTLWTWGDNSSGRLGINSTEDKRLLPTQVKGVMGRGYLLDIVSVSSGSEYTLALSKDGKVYAWGGNLYGQLGNGFSGEEHNSYVPVLVQNLTDIISISANRYMTGSLPQFSVALKKDGSVWVWGDGSSGQLGNGTSGDNANSNIPLKVSNLTNIKEIKAGYNHILALKNDGTIWAWGDNYSGQLGDGTTERRTTPVQVKGSDGAGVLTDIISISAGINYSMALQSDGTILYWGDGTQEMFAQDLLGRNPLPIDHPNCQVDTSVEVVYLKISTLPKDVGTLFPPQGIHAYNPGTEVNVRASGESGYFFSHWNQGTSSSSEYNTIIMDTDKSVTAFFEKPFYGKGDINKDGVINIQDVILALRMSISLPLTIGFETLSAPYLQNVKTSADINSDGEVNISDVILILRLALDLDISADPYQPRQVVGGETTTEEVVKDISAGEECVATLKDGTKVELPALSKDYSLTLSRVSNYLNLDDEFSLNPEDNVSPQVSGSLRTLNLIFDSVLSDTEKLQCIPTITIPKKEVGTLNPDTINILRVVERIVEGRVEREYTLLPTHFDNAGNLTTKDIYLPNQLFKVETLSNGIKSGLPPINVNYSSITFQGTINWKQKSRLIRTVPYIQSEEKRMPLFMLSEEVQEWELKKPIKNVVVLVHGHNESEKTGLQGQFQPNAPFPWEVDYKVDVWKGLYEVFIKEYFDFNSCTVFYEFVYPTWRPIFNHLDKELVDQITSELSTQLALNKTEKDSMPFNLFIVAHSMGGVVSRAGIVKFPEDLEERFQKFISWGSPHRGAAMYSLRYQVTSPAYTAKTWTGSLISSIMSAYVSRTVIDAPGIMDLRWANGTGASRRSLKLDDYFEVKDEYKTQSSVYDLRSGSLIYNERLEQLNASDNRGDKYTFMYGITGKGVALSEISDMGFSKLKEVLSAGEIAIGATINRFLVDKGSSSYLGFMESDSDGAVPITSMTGLGLLPTATHSLGRGVDHESYYGADAQETAEKTFELLGFRTNPEYDPPEITFTDLMENQPLPVDENGNISIEGQLDWKSPRNLTKGVKDIKFYKYTHAYDSQHGLNWEGQEVEGITSEDWSIDKDGNFTLSCNIPESHKVYAIKVSIIFQDDTELQEVVMLGSPEENEESNDGETINWSLTGLDRVFCLGNRIDSFNVMNSLYYYQKPEAGETPNIYINTYTYPSFKAPGYTHQLFAGQYETSERDPLNATDLAILWDIEEEEAPEELDFMEIGLSTSYQEENTFIISYGVYPHSSVSGSVKRVSVIMLPIARKEREEFLPLYCRPQELPEE
ncbi:FG-GAP-like repeat-containing protein [bacterium]|nr:FG-GAP-like repeat-containing protein [bacterium]